MTLFKDELSNQNLNQEEKMFPMKSGKNMKANES